ncbi:MAG: hypothetical protein UHT63_03715 [Acutalibacteraceae bacterium]|nr:hypothetical protein [Acutalibacteraceae bacterium]
MEKSFYKVITDRVAKLLCDNGFKRETNENTEYFTGDNYAVMVDYNEETQCVELKSAALNNGDTADFGVMSSWLLTNESDDRDKLSIANDFEDSLSELIGIKASTVSNRNSVAMPTKQAKAETVDISIMTARFLDMYPAYKDAYKENIATYDEFLYDKFFNDFAVAEFKKALSENNKKRITKTLDWLAECYIKGEEMVVTTVMYTVIAGTLIGDEKAEQAFISYTKGSDKYKYIYGATLHLMKYLKKGKNAEKYM